jgi:hypothetical protein
LHQIVRARLKRRCDANEDSRGERNAGSKERDATVDVERVRKWQPRTGRASNECHERRREEQAHRSTDEPEHERFSEELASESPATSA